MPVYGDWQSSRIGGGGYFQGVVSAPSDPSRYYVYVDVGGLFRSDDGGWSWRMLHGSLPSRRAFTEVRGLIVHPDDADHLHAAFGTAGQPAEGVFESHDGGTTWQHVLTMQFMGNGPNRSAGFVLVRDPNNADRIGAAGIGDGVAISEDGGHTWRRSGPEGMYATDLVFDRANPDRLWLCAVPQSFWAGTYQGGFFRSEDGGRTWDLIAEQGPSELLQDPNDPSRLFGILNFDGVYVSTDAGDTWTPFFDGLNVKPGEPGRYDSPHRYTALAAGPDFVLTASSYGDVYRLNAGQDQWQPIKREWIYDDPWWGSERHGWRRHFGRALGTITINPRHPDHWFVTDWYAIHQTFDGGRNWYLAIDGAEVTVIHVLQQDPANPERVHLGMADNGYLRSEDGGRSFVPRRFKTGADNIKSLSLSPVNPDLLYATGPAGWGWRANRVFVSKDGGEHWDPLPQTGLPDPARHNINTVVVDPANPEHVYIAVSGPVAPNGGGPYRSLDGGQTWTWFGEGLPEGASFYREMIWDSGPELAVAPGGNDLVTLSREHGPAYRWQVSEGRWMPLPFTRPGTAYSVRLIHAGEPAFLVARQGDGVYRLGRDDADWTLLLEADVSHLATDMAHPARMAAATNDGILYSADHGNNWTVLDRSLPFRRHNTLAFAGDRLIAGSTGNGVFWMDLKR